MVHSDVHAGECMIQRKGRHLGFIDTQNVLAMALYPMCLFIVQHLVGICVLGSSADDAWYNSHSVYWISTKMRVKCLLTMTCMHDARQG